MKLYIEAKDSLCELCAFLIAKLNEGTEASMRLNRWVRIGILLSFIWAVGAAIHTHNDDVKNANFWVKLDYDSCASSKQANHDADL
jgi:hypothetical protein